MNDTKWVSMWGNAMSIAVVVEREAECASGKRCIDRIAQRQIFCVAFRMMFCEEFFY